MASAVSDLVLLAPVLPRRPVAIGRALNHEVQRPYKPIVHVARGIVRNLAGEARGVAVVEVLARRPVGGADVLAGGVAKILYVMVPVGVVVQVSTVAVSVALT